MSGEYPTFTEISAYGARTAAQYAVLSDRMRAPLEQSIEQASAELTTLADKASADIHELEEARSRLGRTRQELDADSLPVPRPWTWLRVPLYGLLLLIASGEYSVIKPIFQVLGLSDRPIAAWLPLDQQGVAALSILGVLLGLAHLSGVQLAAILGEPVRRAVWYRTERSRLPFWITVGGVIAVLVGLTTVRESYLVAAGRGGVLIAVGFGLVNLAMVVTAHALAWPDRRPHAARWAAQEDAVEEAEDKSADSRAALDNAVAEHNRLVTERETLLAETAHLLDAIHADTRRQLAVSAGFGRPEGTMTRCLIPTPEAVELREEIRSYLAGQPSSLRRYDRADTQAITEQWRSMQNRLAEYGPPPPLGTRESVLARDEESPAAPLLAVAPTREGT